MHTVLYGNDSRYSCFPNHVKAEQDGLWVGFNWNTVRTHMGGLDRGQSGHVELYSPDGGGTSTRTGRTTTTSSVPKS